MIGAEDLGIPESSKAPMPLKLRDNRNAAERDAIVKALSRVGGNIQAAADLLGVSRPTVYDLINRHGLKSASTENSHED